MKSIQKLSTNKKLSDLWCLKLAGKLPWKNKLKSRKRETLNLALLTSQYLKSMKLKFLAGCIFPSTSSTSLHIGNIYPKSPHNLQQNKKLQNFPRDKFTHPSWCSEIRYNREFCIRYVVCNPWTWYLSTELFCISIHCSTNPLQKILITDLKHGISKCKIVEDSSRFLQQIYFMSSTSQSLSLNRRRPRPRPRCRGAATATWS